MTIRNILRLLAALLIVVLAISAVVWAYNNRESLFKTSTQQTSTSDSSQTQNNQSATQSTEVTQADKPKLEAISPQDNFTTKDEKVTIKGQTTQGNTVTINNQEIPVDSDGNFSQSIVLSPGTNRISVIAKDSSGKTNEVGLIYTRDENAPATQTPAQTDSNPEIANNNSNNPASTTNTTEKATNSTSQPIRSGGEDFTGLPILISLGVVFYMTFKKRSQI